jgi:hypothetical protein
MLQVQLSGRADLCRVTLFTVAMQKIASVEVSGNFSPGWVSVPLPSGVGLAAGLYYAQAIAEGHGVRSLPGAPARVYLLP